MGAQMLVSVRCSPLFNWIWTGMSLSLIGIGLMPWATNLLVIAKPTPASLFFPPLQKIVWLFSTILPYPGRYTLLSAQMSIHSLSSSLQIIAVAHSGLIESALSLVVCTFQAPKIRCSLLGGFIFWDYVLVVGICGRSSYVRVCIYIKLCMVFAYFSPLPYIVAHQLPCMR